MSNTSQRQIQVLHVNDEPGIADLTETVLQRNDDRFTIEAVTSANEGLQRINDRPPDCVVSGYDITGMTGIEFLETVRDQYPELPFIIYTDKDSEAVASDAISSGATDFMHERSDSEQYLLLANRIDNTVTTYRSLQRAERQKERFELLFEESPLGAIQWDEDFQFERLNKKAEEILGYTEAELHGEHWELIVAEADRSQVGDVVERLLSAEGGHHVINRIVRNDGTVRTCEWHNRVVTDAEGETQAIFSKFQDITEKEKRREKFERQVDLFDKAQDMADVGAWEYDLDADELSYTDETNHIYGLPVDTTPSVEESIQYYHPEDRPIIDTAFETVVEEGEPYDVELRLIDAEDNQRWVRTRGEPQYEDGELNRVRGTIQDITERKEREETLMRRTEAIDEAPVGVSISDPDRADNPLIYVNDAFVELTGYPRDAVLGENCRFLQGDNTDPDRVASIREAIDAEEPVSVDLRNYRKDGTEFWNHLEIAPVTNDDGEVVNYIGFQQDVSERKQRQEQLAILDRVLRHNLRNRMNVIRGRGKTIQSEASSEVADTAGKIVDVSDQLIELADKERRITELLREEPTRKEIEACEQLQQITSRVESEHPEATIAVDCSEKVTVRVTAEFGQAIEELVTNAIVHNDASSPEVTLTVTQADETVRIEIADTAPLIPEMERDLLVGRTGQTPLYHGSGLGLWLVNLIITRSNGTITVRENSPAGNIVSIELSQ